MRRRLIRSLLISMMMLLLPGTMGSAGAAEPVRLMLQWTHQAQFTGYYVAKEKGLYSSLGLDVTIIQGGPKIDQLAELEQGNADFATAWLPTGLTRRSQGLPLVHVAQIVNESNLVMVSWKNSDLPSAKTLRGQVVSIWEGDFRAPYLDWFQSEEIDVAAIVPQYYSVNLFLRKGVTACSAMYYNELHMVYQAGVEADEFFVYFLKDYGFGFPEDGIYCLEQTMASRPETVASFRQASLQGWQYAADHPEEALDIVMKYVTAANVPTNRPHMKWMMEKILASSLPGVGDRWKLGELRLGDYDRTVKALVEQGTLSAPMPINVFTGKVNSRVP